jgi:uncharacterized protein (DUF1800 family)
MLRPTTLATPYLLTLRDQQVPMTHGQRLDRWFHTAVVAPDQLRQRVAFALSQIFVISDQALTNDWEGVAHYWDTLANDAFGSYRTLLGHVTLDPYMGRYLSHWRNRKASGTTEPDENYAREVMQLFSIGLVWRNPDFTPMLDGLGQPIPTYDQAVISELAQVFTGYADACPNPPGSCNSYSSISSGQPSTNPMVCFPRHHDTSTKVLLDLDPSAGSNVVTLPAHPTACDPTPATQAEQDACRTYCTNDLQAALDMLAAHPNVAPFLSRQLIQRLVTVNPSAAYVQRVSTVFTSSGGNLGATVKAILTDAEARAFDPNAPDFGQPANFGKTREPLLRTTAIWRAFAAQPGICTGTCISSSAPPPPATELRMGIRSPQDTYGQRPLGAPSVFNFYEPDYQQPGPIAAANLFSPEFQITNETTIATTANDLWSRVWAGYSTTNGAFTAPTTSAYLSSAELDALPTEAGALIDQLDARLMYGTMSGSYTTGNCTAGTGMKGVLYELLSCQMAAAEHRRRALAAIHLIAISPEFSVQR